MPGRRSVPATLSGEAYLGRMLRTLWPGSPAPIRLSRFSRRKRNATEFVVIPHLRAPKLILPRAPRRVTAAAVRNYKASATGRTRLMLRSVASAVRFGGAFLLPDRIRVDNPSGQSAGIERYLENALGERPRIALYIGPHRAVQKPILQLLTSAGETIAFAKVGVNELTRQLVRAEADALRFLNAQHFEHLVVPRLLSAGRWEEHEVLIQQALSVAQPEPADPEQLALAMAELARSRGVVTELLETSVYAVALVKRLDAEAAHPLATVIRTEFNELLDRTGTAAVAFGSWHGDWAPWNMVCSASSIMLWDWEQFEFGVPLGFDAVHFHVQQDVVMKGADPVDAFGKASMSAPELLAPFGLTASESHLVMTLYVLELATRYVHDNEMEGATKMGRVERWLAPVLASLRADATIASRPAR